MRLIPIGLVLALTSNTLTVSGTPDADATYCVPSSPGWSRN